jgi:predicted nucleic acid-binding protein
VVLVDTSIWIRSLLGREPFRGTLDRLLTDEMVLGHDLVLGELLVADTGGRGPMLSTYQHFAYAPNASHSDVVSLVGARRLSGRGIGWIDAHLLASTLLAGARIYTADVPLRSLAAELGVAYGVR